MIDTHSETAAIEFGPVGYRRARGEPAVQTSTRLSPDQVAELDRLAERHGWSRAQMIAEAVSRYLGSDARGRVTGIETR